jgi:hypothetical protein
MTTDKTTSIFGFVYKKTGGFIGANDRISYESITKRLIFVSRNNDENEKQLQPQDEDKLKQTFSDNGFFKVKNFYSRTGGIVDAFEYTLIATMNGQIQATYWADDSEGKPEGLAKIASAIEQVASR